MSPQVSQVFAMPKLLRLHNTFTKTLEEVRLGGDLVSTKHDGLKPLKASFYMCGPTVYADSHLGHAVTYVRADLFRRFFKSIFNIQLTTVMNITDVDDKILARVRQELPRSNDIPSATNPAQHPFNKLSEDRKSTRLNSSHSGESRMPSSA